MPGRDMQRQPIVEAMRLYVVHGEPDRERGENAIVGTTPGTRHVSDSKRTSLEIGYPEPMKSLVVLSAILVGCGGSDPADFEGQWTVSVTNGPNDCNVMNWNEGDSNSGIPVSITQNDSDAIVDVTGAAGIYLDAVLGNSDVFNGSVDGDTLVAEREGTNSMNMGNCTFTYNATIHVDIDGDTLEGFLGYTRATNGNSDCAALECENRQNLSGNRPPK